MIFQGGNGPGPPVKTLENSPHGNGESATAHSVNPVRGLSELNKNALATFRARERSPVGGAGASNLYLVEKRAHLLSPKKQASGPETPGALPC